MEHQTERRGGFSCRKPVVMRENCKQQSGAKRLYTRFRLGLISPQARMRKTLSILALGAASMMLVGCASNSITGPERKFGRGMNNIVEFVRGGEIRRSMEQSAIFSGPDVGATSGFMHGFNRSLARTFVGAYEIATFPIPNGPGNDYGPIMQPENPVYPANYKPGIIADQSFATDNHIGFSGGDVAPMIPNSRFRIFDN